MVNGPDRVRAEVRSQFVGQTWLHEESGTALMLGAFSQRRCNMAGEQDDRNVSRS